MAVEKISLNLGLDIMEILDNFTHKTKQTRTQVIRDAVKMYVSTYSMDAKEERLREYVGLLTRSAATIVDGLDFQRTMRDEWVQ